MSAKMKPSEAMLKGFEMAGGNQCRNAFCRGDYKKPTAVCAAGAIRFAITGDAGESCFEASMARKIFESRIGVCMFDANDRGMSIPDIAGILMAEGF